MLWKIWLLLTKQATVYLSTIVGRSILVLGILDDYFLFRIGKNRLFPSKAPLPFMRGFILIGRPSQANNQCSGTGTTAHASEKAK